MKLIGLDIGTTSICGIVMDMASGEMLFQSTCTNASTLASSYDFAHLQDPSEILKLIESMLDALLTHESDVAAIGISSQMHGILYINHVGEHVSPVYTWQDARGDEICSGSKTYCDVFLERTNYPVSAGYGMVTHFYNLVNDSVPADAVSMCTIGDYVAMKLAGVARPVTDATLAASLGGFDLVRKCFDSTALQNLGITAEFLPEIRPSGTPLGKYRGTITVLNAIGDNQASYVGAVQGKENCLLINVGTGAQLSITTNTTRTVPHWETRPAVGDGYLLVGALLNGGNAYALIESFFRQVIHLFDGSQQPPLFDKMERVLQNAGEIRNPLKVVPEFYGTRENPEKRGSIKNITPQNFTPLDLMAGTISGLVEELASFYEELPDELRTSIRHVAGAGNGIRKSRYLRSLLEKRFTVTIGIGRYEEEAALGAALYAGKSNT